MAIDSFDYYISNDPNLLIVNSSVSEQYNLYFGKSNLLGGTLDHCKRQSRKWKSVNRLQWKNDNELGASRLRKLMGWR